MDSNNPPIDYDCCDVDSPVIQTLDQAMGSIGEAQKLVSAFLPEIEDKLIAVYEILLGVKLELTGGFAYFHTTKRRTADEILAATEEFFEKLWYQRHIDLHFDVDEGKVPEAILKDACAAANRIEEKYAYEENLGAYDDFELGMISGKLSALRWIMGSEWDNLDT